MEAPLHTSKNGFHFRYQILIHSPTVGEMESCVSSAGSFGGDRKRPDWIRKWPKHKGWAKGSSHFRQKLDTFDARLTGGLNWSDRERLDRGEFQKQLLDLPLLMRLELAKTGTHHHTRHSFTAFKEWEDQKLLKISCNFCDYLEIIALHDGF